MKTLFSIAAVVTTLLGVGWLLMPEVMFTRWALDPDPAGVVMGRRYGVVFIGLGMILWLSRSSSSSPALTAILAGGTTIAVALAALTGTGILSGTLGPLAWISFAAEVLLAVGYFYFLRRAQG